MFSAEACREDIFRNFANGKVGHESDDAYRVRNGGNDRFGDCGGRAWTRP
jgi:hypothetical protein